jgi:hypothetical protein
MIQQAKPNVDNPQDAAKHPGVTRRLEGEFIRITIPIKFKRNAGRKQIILPPGAVAPSSPASPPVGRPAPPWPNGSAWRCPTSAASSG